MGASEIFSQEALTCTPETDDPDLITLAQSAVNMDKVSGSPDRSSLEFNTKDVGRSDYCLHLKFR